MRRFAENLPGTGRGTMPSMVEGALPHEQSFWSTPPSVSAARSHLPIYGEEL
jgi:hypothetical protein